MRLARLNRVGEIRHALTGVRAEGHLLDVGGGTGYLASRLTDLFARIVVVDPSAGMLSLARRRNLPTCQASALALLVMGGFLVFDSSMTLMKAEHPTVGTIQVCPGRICTVMSLITPALANAVA